MSDPRCNCGDNDCRICNAPVHRPWTPKAGVSPPPVSEVDPETAALLQRIWHLEALVEGNRWIMLRRYVLVLLMTGLGSLIGSAITIYLLN